MSRRRTPWRASLGLALSLGGLGLHAPARAETSDTLAAVALLGWNLASPELAAVPALSPLLWNGLIDNFAPFLSPYSEAMRKLALTSAPTLKPLMTWYSAHCSTLNFLPFVVGPWVPS